MEWESKLLERHERERERERERTLTGLEYARALCKVQTFCCEPNMPTKPTRRQHATDLLLGEREATEKPESLNLSMAEPIER